MSGAPGWILACYAEDEFGSRVARPRPAGSLVAIALVMPAWRPSSTSRTERTCPSLARADPSRLQSPCLSVDPGDRGFDGPPFDRGISGFSNAAEFELIGPARR